MSYTLVLQPMANTTDEMMLSASSHRLLVIPDTELAGSMPHLPLLTSMHDVDDGCDVVLEATELYIPPLHSTATCPPLPVFCLDSQVATARMGGAEVGAEQSCAPPRYPVDGDEDWMQATCSQSTLKALRSSPSVEAVKPAMRRVSDVALPATVTPCEDFVVCMDQDSLAVTTASPVIGLVDDDDQQAGRVAIEEPPETSTRTPSETSKRPPSEESCNDNSMIEAAPAARQSAVALTSALLARPTTQGDGPVSRRRTAALPHPGTMPLVRRTIKADSEPNASVTINDDSRVFAAKERRTSGTAGVPAVNAHESPAVPFLPAARHSFLRHGLFPSPQVSLQVRRYSDESTASASHAKGNEDSRTFVEPVRRTSELSCPSVRGMSPATMGNAELSSFRIFHGPASPSTNWSFGSRAPSRPLGVFPAAPPPCMRYNSVSSSTPMLASALAVTDEAAGRDEKDEAGQREGVYSPGSPHLGGTTGAPLGTYSALPPPAPPTSTRYQRFACNAAANVTTVTASRPPCPKAAPEAPCYTEGDTESETACTTTTAAAMPPHGEATMEGSEPALSPKPNSGSGRLARKDPTLARISDFDGDDGSDGDAGPTGSVASSPGSHTRLSATERHAATMPHPVDDVNALGAEVQQDDEEKKRKATTCRPRLSAPIQRLPLDRPPRASVPVSNRAHKNNDNYDTLRVDSNEADGPMAGSATPELPSPVSCGRSRGFGGLNGRSTGNDDVLDEERLLRQSLPGELRARMLNNAYLSISSASDDAEERERHSAMREAQIGGFYRKVIALWRESRAMSDVNVEADEGEEKDGRAQPPGMLPPSLRKVSDCARDAPLPILSSIATTTTSSSGWAAHDGGHSARQRSVVFAVPNEVSGAKSTDVVL